MDGDSAGAGFARCEFFLRVVSDDRGNVRHQYRDDELIVRRFEECRGGPRRHDSQQETARQRRPPLLLALGALATALVGMGLARLRQS